MIWYTYILACALDFNISNVMIDISKYKYLASCISCSIIYKHLGFSVVGAYVVSISTLSF
jgi:hypothetical protein